MCRRHLIELPKPLKGMAAVCVMQITLFQAANNDPRIAARCGYKAATATAPEHLATTDDLALVLAEAAPICCYVGPLIYELCLEWAAKCVREKKPVNTAAFDAILKGAQA